MEILDAYIRVSDVGDRDDLRSPRDQEEAIREWIERHPVVELGELVPEVNVSGGDPIQERGLGKILVRIEKGISNGVIVFDTSRFGRDLRETLNANHMIDQAGGRIVGVDDHVDTGEPGGYERLVTKATEAESYLRQVKRRWQQTTNRRVGEGKHTGHVPFGYRRTDQVPELREFHDNGNLKKNGRLVVHDDEAELVLHAFQLRASGTSHLQIAKAIGRKKATVTAMLQNRIYLGEIKGSGGAINRTAHDPIISEELFAAVQATIGTRIPFERKHDGYQPLLKGLIRCADCGCIMQIQYSRRANGENRAMYHCMSPSNNRKCGGGAAVAENVDEYVLSQLDLENAEIFGLYMGVEHAWRQAKAAVEQAETELDNYVEVASALDPVRFQRGLNARQQALNDARANLYSIDDPGLGDDLIVTDFSDRIEGLQELVDWGVLEGEQLASAKDQVEVMTQMQETGSFLEKPTPQRQMQRLRRVIAEVTLSKADPARRRWQPMDERVVVRWKGQSAPAIVAD